MNFTEPAFMALFAVTYVLWLGARRDHRLCATVLLASSLIFFGYHEKWLLALLLSYCVVNWAVGCWIARGRWPRLALAAGLSYNLLMLSYWKYTPLLLRTLAGWSFDVPTPAQDWIIPFGISFYAFTGIAYMVDVYRQEAPAEPNFWRFTLSITFFPHLVAGPILRYGDFLGKLQPDTMPTRPEEPFEALLLLARGYFKKMVLADRLALAIDPFFAHVSGPATEGVWALPYVYLYALQIYLDFSAYTDIARGLGLLFGYRWPENFNLPYLADSVQEFWRRWHMTLSLFLRDYLYVPLGGGRKGWLRTNLNLMATMLLGGLWHGASWSFLFWGGIHGAMLVGHRCWQATPLCGWLKARAGWPRWAWSVFCMALTFNGVCLAWCFFRLTELPKSLACVRKWFFFDPEKMLVGGAADLSLWLLLLGYGAGWLLVRSWPAATSLPKLEWSPWTRGLAWGSCAGLLVLAAILSPGGEKPAFIYFQF